MALNNEIAPANEWRSTALPVALRDANTHGAIVTLAPGVRSDVIGLDFCTSRVRRSRCQIGPTSVERGDAVNTHSARLDRLGAHLAQAIAHPSGAINRALDTAVERAHRLLPGRYHPYFLFEDLGAASFVLVGFAFSATFGALNPWTHAIAIGTTFLLYTLVYLKLKRRLTGVGARSAVQDSVLFVTPVYLTISLLMGQDLPAALDVLAISLLLAVAWMRLGCFVSGCCHGKPSWLGVQYRSHVLRDVDGARLYTTAPPTNTRVFPCSSSNPSPSSRSSRRCGGGRALSSAPMDSLWPSPSSRTRPCASARSSCADTGTARRSRACPNPSCSASFSQWSRALLWPCTAY